MVAAIASKQQPSFWLCLPSFSARIETAPGTHVVTRLRLVDGLPAFDSDGPDDEALAATCYAALDQAVCTAEGFQGWDASADAQWSASDAAYELLASEQVPAWLETLRAVEAL
jgi:hypothetical protein